MDKRRLGELVKELPVQPFKVGDLVRVGTAAEIFTVAGYGVMGIRLYNNDPEFVRLAVPGFDGRVFSVHKQFLSLANSLTRVRVRGRRKK